MKKFIIFVILLIVMCLSACDYEKVDNVFQKVEQKDNNVSMFVIIEENDWFAVVYHRETKVIYSVSKGINGGRGVFTVLVDENGKPILWKE